MTQSFAQPADPFMPARANESPRRANRRAD